MTGTFFFFLSPSLFFTVLVFLVSSDEEQQRAVVCKFRSGNREGHSLLVFKNQVRVCGVVAFVLFGHVPTYLLCVASLLFSSLLFFPPLCWYYSGVFTFFYSSFFSLLFFYKIPPQKRRRTQSGCARNPAALSREGGCLAAVCCVQLVADCVRVFRRRL